MAVCHRDRSKALLATAIEHALTGHGQPSAERLATGPWDVWWVCYRTQRAAAELSLDPRRAPGSCERCAADAAALAFGAPPLDHPDGVGTGRRGCSCLLEWATSMRRQAPDAAWPPWRLTVGMVKPDTEPAAVRELLAETHTVLDSNERVLTPADVRRLYPDAYGADYVARQDDYLTSLPVTVFVLLTNHTAVGNAKEIKVDIRRRLGGADALRNHLHMPDSPGDAFADLDHLAGTDRFTQLYERYERDRAAHRLARYRDLLVSPGPEPRSG